METLRVGSVSSLRARVDAVPASPRFLGDLARVWLTHALGLAAEGPETVRVRLALVEALTNVVRHAYAGRPPGPMEMTLAMDGEEIVAVIEDEGTRFEPREDASLPAPSDLRESGYGLGIIREVMDDVEYDHDPERGNRLTLRKRLWT